MRAVCRSCFPLAQNSLNSIVFQTTYTNRVSGQPLFLKNLNCGRIDPNKHFVLNRAAWSEPAPDQCTESGGFGRICQLREGLTFQIRGEFFNIFNRVYLNEPRSTNAIAPQTALNGIRIVGFGYIDSGSAQW